jgi:hypothetical protein
MWAIMAAITTTTTNISRPCGCRVGYLAQDAPVYARLPVAAHLTLGARLNPGWDAGLARDRVERLELDPRQCAPAVRCPTRSALRSAARVPSTRCPPDSIFTRSSMRLASWSCSPRPRSSAYSGALPMASPRSGTPRSASRSASPLASSSGAVPAMAVTLAIFAVVQVAVPLWVRPHLLPPDRTRKIRARRKSRVHIRTPGFREAQIFRLNQH